MELMKNKRRLIISLALLAVLVIYYVTYGGKRANESATDIPGAIITPMIDRSSRSADTARNEPATEVSPAQKSEATPAPTPPAPAPEPAPKTPTSVLSGVAGRDVRGDVTFVTTTAGTFIRLEDNFFSPSSAPDNRVYLGDANGRQIEISKLKAPTGGQNFAIPADVNLANYSHIWIHCKAFNTTYGVGQILR